MDLKKRKKERERPREREKERMKERKKQRNKDILEVPFTRKFSFFGVSSIKLIKGSSSFFHSRLTTMLSSSYVENK
jgi:hypothetical protein